MRVLHINCNYIGTALHQLLIEKLDERGCENSVFAPTYDKNLSVITPKENVVVSECFKKWDRLFFDYKQKKIFKAVEKSFSVNDFDVIHAYTLFTDGNCARKLSEKYGLPYVVAVRNTDVNSFFRLMPHLRKRGVTNMMKASAVFFLSEAYRNLVFEKYVPQKYHEELIKKTYVIPNGIDDYYCNNSVSRPKLLSDAKSLRLIYAGRIDKNKNILTTQKAIDLLCEKGFDVSFNVIGKIADDVLFERIIKDERTQYFEPMPKERLIEKYREGDIFVMPSFSETFGLVYAEAMSQGLPVVYTKGQGFDCQFEEGFVGYHINADNAEEVAEAIEKIAENYETISSNAINGYKKFSWNIIADKYMKLYDSLN